MSNGIVHSRMTRTVMFPATILLVIFVYPIVGIWGSILAFISSITGFIFTLWINCDSDQFGIVTSEWWIIKKFSTIGWIAVGLYDPYARMIPRHRHFLSHGPVIGSVLRIIYTLLIIFLGSFFIPILHNVLIIIWNNWDLLIYFTISVCISDFFHAMLDFVYPFRIWYEKLVQK